MTKHHATNKDSVEEQVQELHTLSPPSKHSTGPPMPKKTGINDRLDEALRVIKPKNRSSDLVPLSHQFDTMRKELKALTTAAKTYQTAMLAMDQARIDVSKTFCVMVLEETQLRDFTNLFTHKLEPTTTDVEEAGRFVVQYAYI